MYLSPEEFRKIVGKIEKVIVRKKTISLIIFAFSKSGILKIMQMGIINSLKLGLRYLFKD